MRVCKTWHQTIRKHHAWTVIDFRDREDGPQRKVEESCKCYKCFVSKTGPNVFQYRECGNPWRFRKTETNVLKFLKQFAGKPLQELYVGGAIKRIFKYDQISKYLERNCPNIKVLDVPIYCKSYENLLFLPNPQFLKKLKLYCHCEDSISRDINDQYISYISKCSHNLQILDLETSYLSLAVMKTLSKMTQLRELDLSITDAYDTVNLFTYFESTVGKLVFLRVFRLTISTNKSHLVNFDHILIAIAHWSHLENLALYVDCAICDYSREAFEIMVSGLINLETLELEAEQMMTSSVFLLIGTHLKKLKALKLCSNEVVGRVTTDAFEMMISGLLCLESLELDGGFGTSSVVELIGIHLKKLKSLQLSCGSYSAESLQTLSHHPTLENLAVVQSYEDGDNWIGKLYTLLVTLPKIRKVNLQAMALEFTDVENIDLVIDSAEVQVLVGTGPWTQEPTFDVIAKEKKWKRTNAK